jgi:hypothetical protein
MSIIIPAWSWRAIWPPFLIVAHQESELVRRRCVRGLVDLLEYNCEVSDDRQQTLIRLNNMARVSSQDAGANHDAC